MRSAYYIIISSTVFLANCFPRAEDNKNVVAAITDKLNPFKNDISNDNDAKADTNPIDGISNAFKPLTNMLVPGDGDKSTNNRNGPQLFLAMTQGIIMPSDAVLDTFGNIFKYIGNNPNLVEGIKNIMSPST